MVAVSMRQDDYAYSLRVDVETCHVVEQGSPVGAGVEQKRRFTFNLNEARKSPARFQTRPSGAIIIDNGDLHLFIIHLSLPLAFSVRRLFLFGNGAKIIMR